VLKKVVSSRIGTALKALVASEERQPSDGRATTAEAGLDWVEMKCGLEDGRLRTQEDQR
jgi:hypothetical protein